jgi:hypothetical protein
MVSVVYRTSLLVLKVARLTITHCGRREHPEAPRLLP